MIATQAALSSISPFFIVNDLDETMAFYIEKLGFEVAFQGPEGDPYFAILRRDGVQIFFKVIAPEVKAVSNATRHEWARWDAYVYVQDPDALAEELSLRGEDSIKAKVNEDGLRGFEVVDPNGYIVYFGRPENG